MSSSSARRRSPASDEPTDPDGDGHFEDVNGNGRVDYDDIHCCSTISTMTASRSARGLDCNENGKLEYDEIVSLSRFQLNGRLPPVRVTVNTFGRHEGMSSTADDGDPNLGSADVAVTEQARDRRLDLLDAKAWMSRIGAPLYVRSAALRTHVRIVVTAPEEDRVFERNGLRVFVDDASIDYTRGQSSTTRVACREPGSTQEPDVVSECGVASPSGRLRFGARTPRRPRWSRGPRASDLTPTSVHIHPSEIVQCGMRAPSSSAALSASVPVSESVSYRHHQTMLFAHTICDKSTDRTLRLPVQQVST